MMVISALLGLLIISIPISLIFTVPDSEEFKKLPVQLSGKKKRQINRIITDTEKMLNP